MSQDPSEREKHIGAAMMRIAHGFSVAEVAAAYDVSPRTVANWVKLALGYDDPRSRALGKRLADLN